LDKTAENILMGLRRKGKHTRGIETDGRETKIEAGRKE
jgi:hypothetical protein